MDDEKSIYSFRIMTYNTMLTTPEFIRQNGQHMRARLIPESICRWEKKKGILVDAIVLTEVIDPTSKKILFEQFVRSGFRFRTRPVSRNFLSDYPPKLFSGGIYVVSRHPISDEKSIVFRDSCIGYDCYASKGCVLAKIWKTVGGKGSHQGREVAVNILGTHLQAWDSETTNFVRRQQIQQITTFLAELPKSYSSVDPEHPKNYVLPTTEPLLVAGDFNLDFYSSREELEFLFHSIKCAIVPVAPSFQHSVLSTSRRENGTVLTIQAANILDKNDPNQNMFTSDPEKNSLVGNDMSDSYKMQRFPEGCYEDYMNTMKCTCCPQELLDYVFVSTRHLQPIPDSESNAEVVVLKSQTPFIMNFNATTRRETRDLSDHFPVYAHLQFPLDKNKLEKNFSLEALKKASVTCRYEVLPPFNHTEAHAIHSKYKQIFLVVGGLVTSCILFVLLKRVVRKKL